MNKHKVKITYSTGHGKQSHIMHYSTYQQVMNEFGSLSAFVRSMVHKELTELSVENVKG